MKFVMNKETEPNPVAASNHIVLITLRKVWIQLFSSQLSVNSWVDWVLSPWYSNQSKKRKAEFKPVLDLEKDGLCQTLPAHFMQLCGALNKFPAFFCTGI